MNDEQTRTRFESLLLPLTNDAYNLARWLMKNQEDAEDMVQESYRREVAALVYQRRLHVVNLFIWPLESGRNTAAESFTKDGYNVSHWDRDGFELWAVSDVNADDLRAFAGLQMQQS